MSKNNCIVAVYDIHSDAEDAIKKLEKSGFNMKILSIVARDFHTEEHVVGYYNTGDRMKYWGTQGAYWGSFWGILTGSAFFWIPTVGPMLIAGPIIALILSALEGAVVIGGLSVIGAGLYSIGIPENSIVEYEEDLSAGKFLLIANGSIEEVSNASEILKGTNTKKVKSYSEKLK